MPVNNLSPYQLFQSQKLPGKGPFTQAQYDQVANEFFGFLKDQVPPGSQILSESASEIKYITPEGYTEHIRRSIDGRDPNAGMAKVVTSDKPLVPNTSAGGGGAAGGLLGSLTSRTQSLSEQQLQNLLAQAKGERPAAYDPGISGYLSQIEALSQQLQNPAILASLDPETQAALDAITQNSLAQLNQRFQQDQGTLLADLYGNRINQSSIANNAVGQLLQNQGLVQGQALSDAALRELQTRQYLTDAQRQRQQLALQGLTSAATTGIEGFKASTSAGQAEQNALLDLLKQLSAQQTQRDITSGTLGLGYKELEEQARQANLAFELNQQNADLALSQARSPLNKAISLLSALGQAAGGIGGAIAGIR
jgi:hypothetical protein